ncbi:MAG TPA: enoyl-CoA hydratase/isomerase family protein [Bradyrhizobium sp.]|jgi:enoyl-CoA hydratase/carnithine racemase
MTVLADSPADGVRLITLNRPDRLNAITAELLEDLNLALSSANQDPKVRVIVLTGAGRAFCSGDDLKDFQSQLGSEQKVRAYIERIQDVSRSMLFGDKPVIGAIHGWAVGGGLEWAINCDLTIAAEGSRFFFPEITWGLFVTGAVTALLPRMIGAQKTRELLYFGERFDAAQALQWGMLWKVVPRDRLLIDALAVAERIAGLPPGPVKDLKRILAKTSFGLEAAMAEETAATVRGFLDPESVKRVASFT